MSMREIWKKVYSIVRRNDDSFHAANYLRSLGMSPALAYLAYEVTQRYKGYYQFDPLSFPLKSRSRRIEFEYIADAIRNCKYYGWNYGVHNI